MATNLEPEKRPLLGFNGIMAVVAAAIAVSGSLWGVKTEVAVLSVKVEDTNRRLELLEGAARKSPVTNFPTHSKSQDNENFEPDFTLWRSDDRL